MKLFTWEMKECLFLVAWQMIPYVIFSIRISLMTYKLVKWFQINLTEGLSSQSSLKCSGSQQQGGKCNHITSVEKSCYYGMGFQGLKPIEKPTFLALPLLMKELIPI